MTDINTTWTAYQNFLTELEAVKEKEHEFLAAIKEAANDEVFEMDGQYHKVRNYRGDTSGKRFSLATYKEAPKASRKKRTAESAKDLLRETMKEKQFDNVEDLLAELGMGDLIPKATAKPKAPSKKKVTKTAPRKKTGTDDVVID